MCRLICLPQTGVMEFRCIVSSDSVSPWSGGKANDDATCHATPAGIRLSGWKWIVWLSPIKRDWTSTFVSCVWINIFPKRCPIQGELSWGGFFCFFKKMSSLQLFGMSTVQFFGVWGVVLGGRMTKMEKIATFLCLKQNFLGTIIQPKRHHQIHIIWILHPLKAPSKPDFAN